MAIRDVIASYLRRDSVPDCGGPPPLLDADFRKTNKGGFDWSPSDVAGQCLGVPRRKLQGLEHLRDAVAPHHALASLSGLCPPARDWLFFHEAQKNLVSHLVETRDLFKIDRLYDRWLNSGRYYETS